MHLVSIDCLDRHSLGCLQKYGLAALTKIKKITMRIVGFIGYPKCPRTIPQKNIFLIFVSDSAFL